MLKTDKDKSKSYFRANSIVRMALFNEETKLLKVVGFSDNVPVLKFLTDIRIKRRKFSRRKLHNRGFLHGEELLDTSECVMYEKYTRWRRKEKFNNILDDESSYEFKEFLSKENIKITREQENPKDLLNVIINDPCFLDIVSYSLIEPYSVKDINLDPLLVLCLYSVIYDTPVFFLSSKTELHKVDFRDVERSQIKLMSFKEFVHDISERQIRRIYCKKFDGFIKMDLDIDP
ncbi:hypothetical protein CI610_03594 [invertebrate metagenome]|uniref:Uncharacterized protein n=1 Tax=invertebrate metagenome TaxID=1711999 RepID=A0A2H9T2M9_9ZZZZ